MEKNTVLDIPIFHKVCDLYKILYAYHHKIPKSHRYTIWQKCENSTLKLLEAIIQTTHQRKEEKIQTLYRMSDTLDLLKVLIRLAYDTRTIDNKQYIALEQRINEIGKMIGGWIKFIPH